MKIDEVGATVREQENVVKAMRADVKEKQIIQTAASEALRKADDGHEKAAAYAKLRVARMQLRKARAFLLPRNTALAQARQELYYYNRLEKASKSPDEVKAGGNFMAMTFAARVFISQSAETT